MQVRRIIGYAEKVGPDAVVFLAKLFNRAEQAGRSLLADSLKPLLPVFVSRVIDRVIPDA